MKNGKRVQDRLREHGLKVTPQRKVILEVISQMKNHPTADMILQEIGRVEPDISTATVYKTLDLFAEKGLILRIKTDRDVMRYDPFINRHHHLYLDGTDDIVDFEDDELNRLLEEYFNRKQIPGMVIEDYRVEIKARKEV
jgi:Fur family peroxide stress response transcriptional regulator